jgi:hypothetical protein
MRVAVEALDLKIAVASVGGVAEGRGGLGRSLKAEHALVPSAAGQPIGFLACLGCTLRRCPNRGAVD